MPGRWQTNKMELNEKPIREKYKEFYGKNIEQMELLIKDKRIPLTMKQIIERRLNSTQDDWKDNYFDTCDAAIQFNGKIKIIKDCKILKRMTKNTKLVNGKIKVTESQYKKLKAKEFDLSKLKLDKDLTKEEALSHPIWKYLLGNYLENYVELVFCQYDRTMGLWVSGENLLLSAWCVSVLNDRAGSDARSDLDDVRGRFASVASEMLKEYG